jgi:hypothetical protein
MHVATMQYNPLDCTCWAFSPLEYCEYCDQVCDAALEDFECHLGDWFFLGQEGEYLVFLVRPCPDVLPEGEWDADPNALAAFFEEGRVPTPGPSGSSALPKVSRMRGSAKKTTPLCQSPETGCAASRCNPSLGREAQDLRLVVPSTNTALPFLLILRLIFLGRRLPLGSS